MANEFVAKNGLISQNNTVVNGSLTVTGSLINGLAGNIATGEYSHAEGSITQAIGNYSHAEGDFTEAKGDYSHAEGQETIASGSYSHAEGLNTIALADHQHVQGQWNAISSVPAAFIVGNGTDDLNRSNLIYAHDSTVEITGSLQINGGVTGSLFGTASWATNAQTSSYVLQAISASFASNGGVTQLLAGSNITLSPTNGLGQVTITSTGGGGGTGNTATGSYGSFYDTTTQTNPVGNVPRSMSFNTTAITNGVSISGSTNPFNTYIKTENPGVYNLQFSAQLDKTDGGTDEIVIWLRKNGIDLIDTATSVTLQGNNAKNVAAWNWFVTSAANDYYQIIWYSRDTAVRLFAEVAGGGHPGIPSVIATVNRVDQFLSNTGSFSGSFTGNLIGTASWANNAVTSSYILNAISSSFASTASFITPVNAGSAGLPYIIFNSSAASAIPSTVDFTINTSQLRNGSLVILQGYMSRASGAGTAAFSWTANSNANSGSQTFTSTGQYGIQFYWTAKYTPGGNLRFFRTPATSFGVNNTITPTSFDVPSSSSAFVINFKTIVAVGSMTGATENLTCQIIY